MNFVRDFPVPYLLNTISMKTHMTMLAVALCAELHGARLPLIPAPRMLIEFGAFAHSTNITFIADMSQPREGYKLSIDEAGASVASSDAAGAFYARQTLAQLPTPWPRIEIVDWPAYRWRGLHLDESRHFFGKETVMALLDKMAAHKLNIFHWHLTDDQGWRIDIPGRPELVRYGAVRPSSPRHGTHPSRGTVEENAASLNGTRYGPFFYTESDLKEIVAYAAERHITVVPEIEMPGHAYAALAAYPHYACRPENIASRAPRTIWGIEEDVLCIGNADAIAFLEDVMEYVCRVFPGPYVHIGGDECPGGRWEACEKCRAFREAHGLSGVCGEQAWLTRHFAGFLAARGKRAVGWDECLGGDVPANVIGMSWRDPGCTGAGQAITDAADALARGHEMVMSPNSYCYLDYAQGLENDPYQYARRTLTLERAYEFDPCRGVPENLRHLVLGGQGNNWSEYTWNEYDLDWKVWPRAAALAECLWLGDARPGFADFKSRLAHRAR